MDCRLQITGQYSAGTLQSIMRKLIHSFRTLKFEISFSQSNTDKENRRRKRPARNGSMPHDTSKVSVQGYTTRYDTTTTKSIIQ
mmetsp:Transcript_1733/g.2341  ORF Transcript_1733/g.2341 Transcript_1733/m.2341 type:complete len:84 (+) Transcript_1733:147-398(+)